MSIATTGKNAIRLLMLALALALIHSVLAWVDPSIRFFMGDSGSYLYAAMTGWIPPDRSWLYPLLMRALVFPLGSLQWLLFWQVLATLLVALIAYWVLRAAFRIDERFAAAVALVISVGPELLFFERMVMAESFGLLALAGMLGIAFAYLRSGRVGWLPLLALAGLAVACLRLSLLPVAFGLTVLPPLIRACCLAPPQRPPLLRSALHLAVVVAAAMTVHAGYKTWHATVANGVEDYILESGFFRLGLVLPLVQQDDLRDLGLPDDFHARYPTLADPREREGHLWLPDGMIAGLKRELGDEAGNRAARKIASRAVKRDRLALFTLAGATLRDYFVPNIATARMISDGGDASLPADSDVSPGMRALGYQPKPLDAPQGPVWKYFVGSRLWLTFCLFALAPLSLLVLVLGWNTPQRAPAALLGLTALGLTGGQMLFSHIVSFRYLQPFPFFVWLCVAVIVALVARRRCGAQPVD